MVSLLFKIEDVGFGGHPAVPRSHAGELLVAGAGGGSIGWDIRLCVASG